MKFENSFFDQSNMGKLFVLQDKKKITSHDLSSGILKIKSDLTSKGIGPGKKIVLCLNNSALFCEYLLAGWELGACIVPVSPLSTRNEIGNIISKIKPSMIIYADGKEELLKDATYIDHETILILHTSGSSGSPKGVMLTKEGIKNRLAVLKENLSDKDLTSMFCMLPLSFGHGLISNFLFPLLNGNKLILAPSGSMEIYASLGEIVDEFQITGFSSVPSILKVAANFSTPPMKGTLKNIFCASAPLDKKTWDSAMEWSSGIRVNNMYGMTELASWVAGDLHQSGAGFEENVFSRMMEGEIKVIKENASDEFGELYLKSKSMMRGYFEDEVSTEAVLKNGWFKSGDLGYLTEEHIHLKGRADNVINIGGVKIYPEEINQAVRKNPKIQDCYTVGLKLKENEADFAIGCVLVPVKGQMVKDQEIREFLSEHLSAYKIPGQIKILGKLPASERGKPDNTAIKKLFSINGKGV